MTASEKSSQLAGSAAMETIPVAKQAMTEDDFLDGRVSLIQPRRGYRAGIDAVFLAAAIPARTDETALELGTGVGVASLCLSWRVPGLAVTGLEIQQGLTEIACQNARRNGLEGSTRFIEADLSQPRRELIDKKVIPNTYHHVFANPPYYDSSKSWQPPNESKRQAHMTETGSLKMWVDTACAMARPKGSVTFIHRADALPELISLIGDKLGRLIAFPLWPRADQAAGRVLLQGIKSSRSPFHLSAGMVLHEGEEERTFTPQANAILREGAALDLTE